MSTHKPRIYRDCWNPKLIVESKEAGENRIPDDPELELKIARQLIKENPHKQVTPRGIEYYDKLLEIVSTRTS